MHYRTLIINLFSTSTSEESSKSPAGTPTAVPHTPESETSGLAKYNAAEITQSSAHAISRLARLHRQEYGMGRTHHFGLYAMNLGLFAMLESDTFDVLDDDFLTLASAFSIVASRSPLGRNLFHIFRQSVRAKHQGHRIREATSVPEDLRELFDETAVRTSWDEYAEGLQKLDEDEKYRGGFELSRPGPSDWESGGSGSSGGGESRSSHRYRNPQDFPGLSLFEMLDRYESLSLGKDELLYERSRSS